MEGKISQYLYLEKLAWVLGTFDSAKLSDLISTGLLLYLLKVHMVSQSQGCAWHMSWFYPWRIRPEKNH